VNKVWLTVGALALGALGLAFVLRSQANNAKTVMLEPNKTVKSTKLKTKNSSAKAAGSLEDLTKNAPEPRAVTTDAIVVPPKPAPIVSSTPEVVIEKPKVSRPKPVAVNETPKQIVKPVPKIPKPIEKPQVSSTVKETPPASNEALNATVEKNETSSTIREKPVIAETSPSVPVPSLPLRRSPGSVSIQAGAFKNADNAQALRVQLNSQGFNASVEVGEDGISRVIVGPYPNEETAREAASKISSR
jgi:cell division protein FtsN